MTAFTIDDPRISPCPTTGCWLWTGAMTAGYGHVARKGPGSRLVHRIVWENLRGPIPAGVVLDHVCRQRECCNPDHLRLFTPRENAIYNSTSPIALNAAKTACPSCGTEYEPVRRGGRQCRPCTKAMKHQKYLAWKATQPPKRRITHCMHGHEFTPENTYWKPRSRTRACRACMKRWSSERCAMLRARKDKGLQP